MKLAPGDDVVDQIFPIGGTDAGICLGIAIVPVGFALLWAFGSAGVAEVFDENLDDIVDELMRLVCGDVGQILEFDLPRLTAMPAISLLRLRMNPGDDELLTIGQELDLFLASVPCDDVDDDLGERLDSTKQYGALRRFS